ncbi:MAG: tetratricopeptide repeat protein [Planctomycetes bacterium]|nr:tetratricopeptide repeat protein [Planctomycetota bacterium]
MRCVVPACAALLLAACSSGPMPAIPDDPQAALELAAGLLENQPRQARHVLESIDGSALPRLERERREVLLAEATAATGDLWDAYELIRDFTNQNRFSEHQPRLQDLQYRIGVALLERDASYFIFGSDDEDGRIVLTDFVERYPTDPNTASALQRLGEAAVEAERWDEARRRYERLIEDHPDSEWIPLAHFRRAMAEFEALEGPAYDLPSMRRARAELRDYLAVRKPERAELREPAERALAIVESWVAERYLLDAAFYRTLGNARGEAHWLDVLLEEYPTHADAPAWAAQRDRARAAAGASGGDTPEVKS